MRIEPTSRPKIAARRQFVDVELGFQPFERKFDLPAQAVGGEPLLGRMACGWQRGAEDEG